MIAFFASLTTIAIAELGDKTQILSLILISRYKKPIPICVGIFLAALLNHFIAAIIGIWLKSVLTPDILRWIISFSFLVGALWMLWPEKADTSIASTKTHSIFLTTFVAIFLAELGDKTQLLTMTLAAHFGSLFPVVMGSSLGLLASNLPAVFFGYHIPKHVPMIWVKYGSAVVFVILAIVTFMLKG